MKKNSDNISEKNETLVLELLTDEKIGFDENASYIVEEFMNDLAEVMGMETFRKPETHISPKYGFSGWLPGKEENGKANAIHTYVWDDREPSFWSIDISTTAENLKKKVSQIIEFTRQKLSPYEIVYKTSQAPGDWKELDESIIRQRLSFLAKMKDGFNQENVANFFRDICDVLNMRRLTEPLIEKDGEKTFVWEHWETSGIIGNIENDIMDVNIYTCKYFNPEEALDFTKTRIGDILESIQKF